MPRKSHIIVGAIVGAVGVVAFLSLSNKTRPVTQAELDQARSLWKSAAISDYDMELHTSGSQQGTYLVKVRSGKVVALSLNGKPASTNDPSYWSVDGLFQTIEEQLVHAERRETGAFPADSSVWMRMSTHPKLGYPIRYVRQVTGSALSLEMEVVRLEPLLSNRGAGGG